MSPPPLERITATAIRTAAGDVASIKPPARHPEVAALVQECGFSLVGATEGFRTSREGRFVTRTEAYSVALAAGQILYDVNDPPLGITPTPGTLCSEDVW